MAVAGLAPGGSRVVTLLIRAPAAGPGAAAAALAQERGAPSGAGWEPAGELGSGGVRGGSGPAATVYVVARDEEHETVEECWRVQVVAQ